MNFGVVQNAEPTMEERIISVLTEEETTVNEVEDWYNFYPHRRSCHSKTTVVIIIVLVYIVQDYSHQRRRKRHQRRG